MAETIYIDGARGGAGATTCAFFLGLALGKSGRRTLIVDGDTESGSGLEISGAAGLCVYTLADACEGACRVKQAILAHPSSPNLYILPSLGCKDAAFISEAVASCKKTFDFIICDKTAENVCGRAIVVSDPYPHSAECAKNKAARIKDGGIKLTEILLNKVNGGLVYDGVIPTPQDCAALCRCSLLGVIPEDLALPLGKIRGETKKAFLMTAKKLCGESDKVYGVIKAYYGVKGAIKRKARAIL